MMGIRDTWSRLMYSMNAGWQAGRNAWTGDVNAYLDITSEEAWDDYHSRLQRYAVYDAYYGNTVYKSLNQYARQLKATNKLYRHIRGVYNPVARYAEVIVGFVYGGALDMETLRGGAIPLMGGDDRLMDAIRQLFVWSNWGMNKSLYVRNGERYADSVIKVVDDRAREKVYMELINTRKVADISKDPQGNVKSIEFRYEKIDETNGQPYVYTETIDGEWFRTYRNGEPFAFHTDSNGMPVAEWENEYGFVPVVVAPRKDLGFVWSAPGFAGAPLDKINEINDVASVLHDNIRNVVNLLVIGQGVKKKSEADYGTTKRDDLTMLHIPKDADVKQLHTQIPIGQTLQAIDKMLQELENDLPELSLSSIRSTDRNLTAPGVRSGFGDAIKRVQDTRSNYDNALTRAIQMGVTMGGYGEYDNMSGFDLDSYARGDLDFTIGTRPVIEDTLSKAERVTTIQTLNGDERDMILLQELDFSEEDIQTYRDAEEIKRQMEIKALVESQDEQQRRFLTDEETTELMGVMDRRAKGVNDGE